MSSLIGCLPVIGSLTSPKYTNKRLASSRGTHIITYYLTGQKKSGTEPPAQNITATPTTQVGLLGRQPLTYTTYSLFNACWATMNISTIAMLIISVSPLTSGKWRKSMQVFICLQFHIVSRAFYSIFACRNFITYCSRLTSFSSICIYTGIISPLLYVL